MDMALENMQNVVDSLIFSSLIYKICQLQNQYEYSLEQKGLTGKIFMNDDTISQIRDCFSNEPVMIRQNASSISVNEDMNDYSSETSDIYSDYSENEEAEMIM